MVLLDWQFWESEGSRNCHLGDKNIKATQSFSVFHENVVTSMNSLSGSMKPFINRVLPTMGRVVKC